MGLKPQPDGWTEAKKNSKEVYKGKPCSTCGFTLRYTKNFMCVHCTHKKKSDAQLNKFPYIKKTKEQIRLERKIINAYAKQREDDKRKKEAKEKKPNFALIMCGIRYDGDNAYPDIPPYNETCTAKANPYYARLGSTGAMCLDF